MHRAHRALKSFLPLASLGLCMVLFILHPSSFHILVCRPGTWMLQQAIAGLRGRNGFSLVLKTEGLVLWSGLVPTIPLAEQKNLELQKTKLCSPWLKVKRHIGTTVAKRAIFQQPFSAGQIARASLCDTPLLLTAMGCLTAMAVLKAHCFACLQVWDSH